jgi:hypothetical protein
MKVDQVLKSNDLGLCTSLLSVGVNYIEVIKEGNIVYFIFRDEGNKLNTLANNYWNSNLDVDALTYYNNLKALKHIIYNV